MPANSLTLAEARFHPSTNSFGSGCVAATAANLRTASTAALVVAELKPNSCILCLSMMTRAATRVGADSVEVPQGLRFQEGREEAGQEGDEAVDRTLGSHVS